MGSRVLFKKMFQIFMLAGLILGISARASLLHHFDHSYTDPFSGGVVEIDLDVFDGQAGGKYLWQYTVTNINFNPNPGVSNGFSGFELFLPSSIPEIGNITAPAPGIGTPGWETNCCSGLPLEWDIRNNDGNGVMPGEIGIFSFTTDPRQVAINDAGWFHTWENNSQTSIVTTIGMHVPLVPGLNPISIPSTILLISIGLIGFIWRHSTNKSY